MEIDLVIEMLFAGVHFTQEERDTLRRLEGEALMAYLGSLLFQQRDQIHAATGLWIQGISYEPGPGEQTKKGNPC